jgi:hypothetical protein
MSAPEPLPRRWVENAVIGVALLSNGAALVLHIVRGVALAPVLLVLWAAGLLAIGIVIVRARGEVRRDLRRTFVVGVAAGLVATVAYDIAKAALSQLDPAPWNPFEATRVFGVALLGTDVPDAVARTAGWIFHFTNGATFAMSFAFILGHLAVRGPIWAVGLGSAWGVGLESFQLTLYPGWLGITAVSEFQQVSFLSHLVYGATFGLLLLRWLPRRFEPWELEPPVAGRETRPVEEVPDR